MKKILFACVAMLLSAAVSGAQDMQVIRDTDDLYFYGVDFSAAKIIGAEESPAEFRDMFYDINYLFISEREKYVIPLQKKLQHTFSDIDIDAVKENNASAEDDEMIAHASPKDMTEEQLHQQVLMNDIPEKEGVGLLIVCSELNKTDELGHYYYVFFDNSTFEVKTVGAYSGKAAGFGLRNYWASTLYRTYKEIRPTDFYQKTKKVKAGVDKAWDKTKKGVSKAADEATEAVTDIFE